MVNSKLLEIFQEVKQVLCINNYYIYTNEKILKVTNNETMIPHLMGLQYVGKNGMFTGDKGAYLIKKERIKYLSIKTLVRKYYKKVSKQNSIEAMIYGKIDNLLFINEMLSSYSEVYLYDISANPGSELKTDY